MYENFRTFTRKNLSDKLTNEIQIPINSKLESDILLLDLLPKSDDWIEEKVSPIFTTFDNVYIFDDNVIVFGLLPKSSWEVLDLTVRRRFGNMGNDTSWIHFSTKEARDKYIYENKPSKSLKEWLDGWLSINLEEREWQIEHLKRLYPNQYPETPNYSFLTSLILHACENKRLTHKPFKSEWITESNESKK